MHAGIPTDILRVVSTAASSKASHQVSLRLAKVRHLRMHVLHLTCTGAHPTDLPSSPSHAIQPSIAGERRLLATIDSLTATASCIGGKIAVHSDVADGLHVVAGACEIPFIRAMAAQLQSHAETASRVTQTVVYDVDAAASATGSPQRGACSRDDFKGEFGGVSLQSLARVEHRDGGDVAAGVADGLSGLLGAASEGGSNDTSPGASGMRGGRERLGGDRLRGGLRAVRGLHASVMEQLKRAREVRHCWLACWLKGSFVCCILCCCATLSDL
jgi:hypothetical protein